MAVTIRLARHGQKKRPFYRLVACEEQYKRDGRYLEIVGTYNPMVEESAVRLKEDRIRHWVSVGATQSKVVASLIKKNIPGLLEEREKNRLDKKVARRKTRKAAVAKRSGKRSASKRDAAKSEKKKKSAAKKKA